MRHTYNRRCLLLHKHCKYQAAELRQEKKRKTTPLGVNLMRSQVIYRADQVI